MVDAVHGVLKVVDFGFAGFAEALEDSSGFTTPTGGTPGYKAPDMLRNPEYGKAVDVWSLGVVCRAERGCERSLHSGHSQIAYILLCGFPPFFSHPAIKDSLDFLTNAPYWYFVNEDTEELRHEITEGRVEFPSPFWDPISPEARAFVLALLNVDEATRLSCARALEHPWMTLPLAEGPQASAGHLVLDVWRTQSAERLNGALAELPGTVAQRLQSRFMDVRAALDLKLRERPSLGQLRRRGIIYSPPPE